ncbi:hypothetical protein P7G97_08075 [Enterococcus canintestini]|nr:hypothetical protein [Enterococcus canintestini]
MSPRVSAESWTLRKAEQTTLSSQKIRMRFSEIVPQIFENFDLFLGELVCEASSKSQLVLINQSNIFSQEKNITPFKKGAPQN